MSGPLRVAILAYRGNPHSGGQGVYTRYLAHELRDLGHLPEVVSGPPYPELDADIPLHRLESMDLYRPERAFRPHRWPRTRHDWLELGVMSTGAFCEPLAFSRRADRFMRSEGHRFDADRPTRRRGPERGRPRSRFRTPRRVETVDRLADDHANARRLGEALAEVGLPVDLEQVETNFVLVDVGRLGLGADEAVARLRAGGVLLSFAAKKDVLRAVTHLDVSAEDVERAAEAIPRALAATERPVELAGDAPTPY